MGPWIFATAVLLVVTNLLIKYQKFRKIFLYGLFLTTSLGIGFGVVSYYKDTQREAALKSVIGTNEVSIKDARINLPQAGYSTSDISAIIKNESAFALSSFKLRIFFSKCSSLNTNCEFVYKKDQEFRLNIPSMESRGLSEMIFFDNMPKMEYWTWNFIVTETTADNIQ